ncbi:MAG: DUF2318 domain-containing protein [Chloroflexi bacterium]|nr:DUF2318 domain-containing protein [Chloroflexota bacterium]
MLSSLIITLREGMEIALVLGIILTYLRRTGRATLNRYVYWGLGLAILVSLGVGITLQIIGFDPENEYLEGTLLGIGGIFVASMVLWMWRTAKNIRRQMEARMENIVANEKTSLAAAIGLLSFTFFMVAREGVEMVVFLAATTLGQSGVLSVIGGVLGVGLATLFAILFIRGSLRINLGRFFTVTTIVLLILAVRLLMGSVHEFAEVGAVPMTAGVMRVLGYFVRDRASTLLLTGMILVPMLVVLWDFRRAETVAAAAGEKAAEQRKWRAARRLERTWQFSLLGATAVIALAMVSQVFAASPFIDPTPQPVTAQDGEIKLSASDWLPGELHKFTYSVTGAEVRFLAVKLDDGSVATGVDACQICGIAGYMQNRNEPIVTCKNCNAPIPMNTIGLGGGCNPIALPSTTGGDATVSIAVKELENQAHIFTEEAK